MLIVICFRQLIALDESDIEAAVILGYLYLDVTVIDLDIPGIA